MKELRLPKELTIYTVSSWKEDILEELSAKEDLRLDCSSLKKLDGAGVQLLLSLEKTTFREKFDVELINIGAEIREIIELAGVEELLLGGVENG